jgi:hypothetical protein
LLETFSAHLKISETDPTYEAARHVLSANIVHGDALTMQNPNGSPIVFPEWAYLGKGRFQRRDFRFDALTQMSLYGEGTLFESMDKAEIFVPEKDYRPLAIADLAAMAPHPTERTPERGSHG